MGLLILSIMIMTYIYTGPFISSDLRETQSPFLTQLLNLVFNKLRGDIYICAISILEKNDSCEIEHSEAKEMNPECRRNRWRGRCCGKGRSLFPVVTLNTIQLNRHLHRGKVPRKSECLK